jgi:hypothetical protein
MEEIHEYPEFGESVSSQHSHIQNNKVPVIKAKFNNSRIVIRSHKFPMAGLSAQLYLTHNWHTYSTNYYCWYNNQKKNYF